MSAWTTDERETLQAFQDALADLVDQYLAKGVEPDDLCDIMRAEIDSDLDVRQEELAYDKEPKP